MGSVDEPNVSLTAAGEFELARAAGFDTYDDFLRWKETKPEEYELWYANLTTRQKEEE